MRDIEKLLNEYSEKFNDSFPAKFMTQTDDEICEIIEICIRNNKPYDPKYKEGNIY